MAAKSPAKRSKSPSQIPARDPGAVPSTAPSLLAVGLGAAFLAVSTIASLLLVSEHLVGLSLPGCGAGGACAEVAKGFGGRVRLGSFEWPTAYLGLSYFAAILVAWIATRGAVPTSFRYLVRLGALASVGFCIILSVRQLLCPYCVAAHLGNFAFWITVECTRSAAQRARLAVGGAAGVFIVATLGLGLFDWRHKESVRLKAEGELAGATAEIIKTSRNLTSAPTPPAPAPAVPVAEPSAQSAVPPSPAPSSQTAPAVPTSQPVFTGRYRYGPEVAPIRIVMFTGYQCPDCYNMEGQLVQILAARNDVAVSIKHFPFCADCNPGIKKTTHPNGCWAARAAEAAGILWGAEGFWKMHNWLFSQRGLFETEDALKAGIRSIGFDPTGFVEVMTSDETLRRVQADCREAISLGLNFTPMIFINGVELKGWNAPDALKRAVAAVAATNPPARTAADDHPPTALEKYLADWREQPQRPLPSGKRSWTLGSPDAPYKILLLGDYQEPFTALADQFIRQFVSEHPYTQYTFRHYPVNKECNPQVPDVRHPLACRAAQAAEAAGVLGGPNAFWKLHAWLMEHPKEFNDQALQAAAAQIGLDPGALLVTMATPEVQAAIADDITMGQQMGLQNVPWIIVDGRWVPRWLLEGEDVLGRIVNEAAAKYAPQP